MSDEAAPEKELGPSVPAGAISRELQIINKRGLHARASAKFVQMVEKLQCRGLGDARQRDRRRHLDHGI